MSKTKSNNKIDDKKKPDETKPEKEKASKFAGGKNQFHFYNVEHGQGLVISYTEKEYLFEKQDGTKVTCKIDKRAGDAIKQYGN